MQPCQRTSCRPAWPVVRRLRLSADTIFAAVACFRHPSLLKQWLGSIQGSARQDILRAPSFSRDPMHVSSTEDSEQPRYGVETPPLAFSAPSVPVAASLRTWFPMLITRCVIRPGDSAITPQASFCPPDLAGLQGFRTVSWCRHGSEGDTAFVCVPWPSKAAAKPLWAQAALRLELLTNAESMVRQSFQAGRRSNPPRPFATRGLQKSTCHSRSSRQLLLQPLPTDGLVNMPRFPLALLQRSWRVSNQVQTCCPISFKKQLH